LPFHRNGQLLRFLRLSIYPVEGRDTCPRAKRACSKVKRGQLFSGVTGGIAGVAGNAAERQTGNYFDAVS
jgi:hypothetical protein